MYVNKLIITNFFLNYFYLLYFDIYKSNGEFN